MVTKDCCFYKLLLLLGMLELLKYLNYHCLSIGPNLPHLPNYCK